MQQANTKREEIKENRVINQGIIIKLYNDLR